MTRLFAQSPARAFGLVLLPLVTALACSADTKPRGGSSSDGGGGHFGGADGSLLGHGETASECADGLDNDQDGASDCADSDCAGVAACLGDAGGAGQGDGGDGTGACSTAHGQGLARKAPVDVVWVIDDSLSMLDDITRVQQNMAAFAKSLLSGGLDYHIVVLNEPSLTFAAAWDAKKLGLDPSRFFPDSVVAWNDCFSPAVSSFASYSSHLRPDAALHFIMVTDDNSLMQWPDFKSRMDKLLGGRKFTVHAIVDPPQHCLTSTQPGTVYWTAAEATGGQRRSICEADWTPTFTAIENTIQTTAVVPCQYDIPVPSAGKTYDRTKVNVQHVVGGTSTPFKRKASTTDCGSDPGWFYDNPAAPTQVRLCPAACALADKQGGSINIDFVCNVNMLY